MKKAQKIPIGYFNLFQNVISYNISYLMQVIPSKMNFVMRFCSSANRSIISVKGKLESSFITAILRILYANFLINERLFFDFFAGERSSLKVSSRTWWRLFSILQWFRFRLPMSIAFISMSETTPKTCIAS